MLTSVLAVTCLRAQGGVGPQLESHVYGLRKAGVVVGAGLDEEEQNGKKAKADWLTTDEGAEWLLNTLDELAKIMS